MPTTFANTIDNNPIYAQRAEQDASGNNIAQTYATKSELPSVPVTDVTVDGVSVVSSGTAAITMPTIPSGVQLVPAATSADADKVLTVDSLGVPGWAVVPAQSTGLFQATYGTSTYDEVSDAVAANKIVYCYVSGRMAFLAYVGTNNYEFQYYRSNSSSSGTDSIFVYKVSSSGWTTTERQVKAGNISYPVTKVNVNGASAMTGTVANITIPAAPTVDQTYDAFSANAQSGTAVAGALVTKQNTLTVGDGISLDENDEISAKLGDGLEIGTSLSPVTTTARATGYSDTSLGVSAMQQLYAELVAAIETTGLTYTVQNLTDNGNVSRAWTYWGNNSLKLYPAICAIADYGSGPATDPSRCLVLSTTGIDVASAYGSITAGTQFVYNLDDINTSLSNITWETISDQPENYSLSVVWRNGKMTYSVSALGSYTANELYDSGTLSYQAATFGAIAVSNPLPASTSSDAGKILTVNSSGAAAWGMLGSVTSIQQVNALPATPDANTLYLIPEA